MMRGRLGWEKIKKKKLIPNGAVGLEINKIDLDDAGWLGWEKIRKERRAGGIGC